MTVLDTIKICDASDIVKDASTRKKSVFTSTSVLDLVKLDDKEVLIKYLLPRKSMAKTDWQTLLSNEVEKLKELQVENTNLVKIRGFVKDIHFERRNNNFPGLVVEYFNEGNLQNYIEKHTDLPWKTRYEISLKITEGLRTLHEFGLYHYDLKISNILMRGDVPYLSDYGFSVVNDPCRSNGIYSAPLFLSPIQLEELFLGSKNPTPYNEKDDIYSLSFILYYLAYLKKPWVNEIKDTSDASLICSILFENKRPSIKGKVLHPDFEKLITQCWNKSPNKRPGIEDIIKTLNNLLNPDETFKSEVLNKFDSMPTAHELKIKEQELRKEQELKKEQELQKQKEKEKNELEKLKIKKESSKEEVETTKSPSVKSPTNDTPSIKSPTVKSPSLKSPSIKSPVLSSSASIMSMQSTIEFKKDNPNHIISMENFEEEKRLANKKKEEERQNEKLKMEQEALEKVMNAKKINDEKENQLKLEKSRREQEYLLRQQEDEERHKIRDALLRQLELKKAEAAKQRELEKIELTKQKEKEAFEKIEKAKNILLEKEKEKLKKEQEERENELKRQEEIKKQWEISQQKTKELEKKKEEERLKKEQEKLLKIKLEEEENFQKTLKAREVEEQKI